MFEINFMIFFSITTPDTDVLLKYLWVKFAFTVKDIEVFLKTNSVITLTNHYFDMKTLNH